MITNLMLIDITYYYLFILSYIFSLISTPVFYEIEFLHQFLQIVIIVLVLIQLECPPIGWSHILQQQHRLDVRLQRLQLVIGISVIVWQDRDAIIQLVDIRICGIVYQNHISQLSIQDPQILHMHSLRRRVTMLSK